MIRILHNFDIFLGNKQLEVRELVLEPPFSAWSFDTGPPLKRTIFGFQKSFSERRQRILIPPPLPFHIFRFLPHMALPSQGSWRRGSEKLPGARNLPLASNFIERWDKNLKM